MTVSKEGLRAGGITLVFMCVTLFGVWHHEVWRDEVQSWLIAANAHSFAELFENCRYEGHPMLWHSILYLLSRCTDSILAMQLLSVGIVSGAVFLFCLYSPLSRFQQTLFVFGFYPVFQYCILSRSYGFIFLGVVAYLCIQNRHPQSVWSWFLLALMANTAATGCVLACCFAATVFVTEWLNGKSIVTILQTYFKHILVLTIGLSVAAWQIYPEADNVLSPGFSLERLRVVFSQLHDSYTYIAYWPNITHWSTVFMRDVHWLDLGISLAVMMVFIRLFAVHKSVLFFYVSGTIAITLFLTVSGMFSARFIGHFYLILIAAYWFASESQQPERRKPLEGMMTVILVCQCITGFGLLYSDYTKPFSNAEKAAQYIRNQHLDSYPVTGAIDYTLSPISYWLHKPLYYQETQANGTFIVWSNKRNHPVTPETLRQQTDSLVQLYDKTVVVLSSQLSMAYPSFAAFTSDSMNTERTQWVLLQKMEGALVTDENYYVYLASRKK